MPFFEDLMPSLRLSRWTPSVLRRHLFGDETESLESLCAMMIASDGEYSALLLAERILNAYEQLDAEGRLAFFWLLHDEYDIDADAVRAAVEQYENAPDADNLLAVTNAAEPGRQELLRRINQTPGGTRRLVRMRAHLLEAIRKNPELRRIDTDFHHLFNAWFNRGFLLLEPVDWTTPAHILEKIIAYEAVHEIESWDALRSRLQPEDRYCYAFFHPSMEDEPLVFVEVALTGQVPRTIAEILEREADDKAPENPTCAVFYSISNCHRGLAGVSFGNFLIKQVATSLQMRFPQLKTFATISPVPGLHRWLETRAAEDENINELLAQFDTDADERRKDKLESLAAHYLVDEKTDSGEALDPVARFHLRNGAQLERINLLANPSDKGMQRALGTMVNYVYDLGKVEENHEDYVRNHRVACGGAVKKALAR